MEFFEEFGRFPFEPLRLGSPSWFVGMAVSVGQAVTVGYHVTVGCGDQPSSPADGEGLFLGGTVVVGSGVLVGKYVVVG